MKRSNSGRTSSGSFRVVWDEANLDFLETHKTPKQKIDEPKTPYHPPLEDGTMSPTPDENRIDIDAAVHAQAIRDALAKAASTSSSWSHPPDDRDEVEHDFEGFDTGLGRRKSFEQHRRDHYDEFKTVKLLQCQGSLGDEEEEEDDHKPSLAGGVAAMKLESAKSR